MSKNNNVNPGQYKVAGRERMGEHLNQQQDKQEFKKSPAGNKDKQVEEMKKPRARGAGR